MTLSETSMLEITLTYSCKCVESWQVFSLPEEQHRVSPELCPVEHCPTCAASGVCAGHRDLPPYIPVDFDDVHPIRKRYVRMKVAS